MTNPRKDRLLSRDLVSILVAQTCFGYSFSSFLLFPKFLVTELGANPAQIGQVATANRFSTMVGLLVSGVMVDRFGRRPFLTAGAVLMTLASLSFYWVHEFGSLIFLLRGCQGLAFGMAFAAGSALVVDLAPPRKLAQAIGYFGLTMLSTNALAPLSVEALAAVSGWRFAFAAAALGAGACVLASFLIREPRRGQIETRQVSGLLQVALDPKQLRCALVIAIVGAAFATVFVLHQPFAVEVGLDQLSLFFVAYTGAALLVRLGAGPFVDRIGRSRVAVGSLFLYAVAVSLTADLPEVGLLALGALLGLAHGFFYPSFNALAVEGANEHDRGKIMAVFQAWFTAGGAFGTFALGALAHAQGYPVVFLVVGVAAFLALGVLAISPEGRPAFRR